MLAQAAKAYGIGQRELLDRSQQQAFQSTVYLLRRAANVPIEEEARRAGVSAARVSQIQGRIEHHAGKLTDAESLYLGEALLQRGQVVEAGNVFRQVLNSQPCNSAGLSGLGMALVHQYRNSEAIDCLRKAVQIEPANYLLHKNLGIGLFFARDFVGAIVALRKTIALANSDNDAHIRLGCCLLANGQFEEGWTEFEWRTKGVNNHYHAVLQAISMPPSVPEWNGEPLAGKTIALISEQGFGDAIQFIRFASSIADLGATVYVICALELKRLFCTVRGISEVSNTCNINKTYDYCCWLMSDPRILGTQRWLDSFGQKKCLR